MGTKLSWRKYYQTINAQDNRPAKPGDHHLFTR